MTAGTLSLRPGLRRALRHTPWSAQGWWDSAQVLAAWPVAALSCLTIVVMALPAVLLSWSVWPAAVLGLAVLGCVRRFTQWQRARLAALTGFDAPPIPAPAEEGSAPHRLRAALGRSDTWRQVAYHLAAPFLATAGGVAVAMAWAAALMMTTAPAWSPLDTGTLVAVGVGGLVALFAAPWVAHWVGRGDVALARLLLSLSQAEALARRVDTLTVSRKDVIAAADAERRRIERDLHDGAQQRLVSLAMNLGIARVTLTDLPEPARAALEQAHDEAKQAVKELRDLVRGLNPAILTEQGLDAALSGLAARSAVPVRLAVDIPRRPVPSVESVAFFVVSEALTNVARHARATRAEVTVTRGADGVLRVRVTDDGRGGANLAGGGLRGLAQRVGSVDGILRVDSPAGGPTTITAEMPCG